MFNTLGRKETVMDTAEALSQMGVTEADFTEDQRRQFDEDGYFIVPGYLSPAQVKELQAEFDRSEREAISSARNDIIEPGGLFLHDLFNKSPAFDCCLAKPTFAAAHHLMGEIRVFSLNGRNPAQGSGQQNLHSDVARLAGDDWRLVNTMIMLDDMTEANGATRLVPGSHRLPPLNVPPGNMEGVEVPVPSAPERALLPEDAKAPHPDEIKVTGEAGSICVLNAHIWHGGTLNQSGAPRRLLHLAVGRRDVPPGFDHRKHLSRGLLERSSPARRYLFDIEGAEPTSEAR
jgi:ectoine hydroxylase-related dioxygenase (phytanoyl-CoA dioxygenase family)